MRNQERANLERAVFEKSIATEGLHVNLTRIGPASQQAGEYADPIVQTCWKVWQLARTGVSANLEHTRVEVICTLNQDFLKSAATDFERLLSAFREQLVEAFVERDGKIHIISSVELSEGKMLAFYRETEHAPAKRRTIILVNGCSFTISDDEITYSGVVKLALAEKARENVLYTVIYERGVKGDSVGSLTPGKSVKIRDGMVFSVANTSFA
jgi:hypothetical protein